MNNKKKKKFKIEKLDILLFIIIIAIYGVALLAFFPGLLTSDCVDQINQAKINLYNSAHPIVHTFVIGNLTKLGGIWVPALFQIILFALIWTYMCKTLRKYNKSKLNKFLQIIFTLVVCYLPLNYLYSITLWKDIIYSYAMLLVLVLTYIGIKENYRYNTLQIILISLSTATVMFFRHNGLPIGLFMFVIILFLNVIKQRDKRAIIKFIISFIIALVIMNMPKWIVNRAENVLSQGNVLNSTKIYCFGRLLNCDIELEKEEEEFLNKILELSEWKENYNPYTGTPILFNPKLNSSFLLDKENEKKFDEIFKKYANQKSDEIIKHFVGVNSIWWSIEEKAYLNTVLLENSSVSEMSNGIYDNKPILKEIRTKLNDRTLETIQNKSQYKTIYRPAFALYVSLIIILFVAVKEKKWGYILLAFPMLLNIGTYIILISSQDLRYFYPCFMTEYFSILILFNVLTKTKISRTKKNNIEMNMKNPKTLVIIPAYNEEKSVKNVIESIYNEEIENCDVVLVNDGSRDNTYVEAIKTNAVVLDLPNNLGIGGAVQAGYLYASKNNYDIAIQVDGDGQHDPKYIKELIDNIKSGNDLVIGSRFIEKTGYDQTFGRMLGINIISFIIKIMTKKKIYDVTSGFRAVNKNIIEEFAEIYPYDYPEPCTNMTILKKGYKVKEIPVEMRKRATGVSSISQLKSIIYMLKVTIFLLIKGIIDEEEDIK